MWKGLGSFSEALVLFWSLSSSLAIPWLSSPVFQKKIGNRSVWENEFLLLFGQTGEKWNLILFHCVVYVCLKMNRLHEKNTKGCLVLAGRLWSTHFLRRRTHLGLLPLIVLSELIFDSNSGLRKMVRHSVLKFPIFQTEKWSGGGVVNGVVDVRSWYFSELAELLGPRSIPLVGRVFYNFIIL